MMNTMSKYMCSECDKESAVMSSKSVLEFPCCKGETPVKQNRIGVKPAAKIEPAKVMSGTVPNQPLSGVGNTVLDKTGGNTGKPAAQNIVLTQPIPTNPQTGKPANLVPDKMKANAASDAKAVIVPAGTPVPIPGKDAPAAQAVPTKVETKPLVPDTKPAAPAK